MIRKSYDEEHDILYLSVGGWRSVEDEEVQEGVYIGYNERDEVIGAMIFGFINRPRAQKAQVAQSLARLLGVSATHMSSAILGSD